MSLLFQVKKPVRRNQKLAYTHELSNGLATAETRRTQQIVPNITTLERPKSKRANWRRNSASGVSKASAKPANPSSTSFLSKSLVGDDHDDAPVSAP